MAAKAQGKTKETDPKVPQEPTQGPEKKVEKEMFLQLAEVMFYEDSQSIGTRFEDLPGPDQAKWIARSKMVLSCLDKMALCLVKATEETTRPDTEQTKKPIGIPRNQCVEDISNLIKDFNGLLKKATVNKDQYPAMELACRIWNRFFR